MRFCNTLLTNLIRGVLNARIPIVTPIIQAELPHDKRAFTQGLAFINGKLAESTGLDTRSSIRRICARTGKLELSKELPGHWGEGIAYQDGKLIQLTWKSQMAIVYRWPTLEKIGEYYYDGQGWGLTSAPCGFVMTDGGDEIVFRDNDFRITRTKCVTRKRVPMRWLNDLAYAQDRLYVNRLAESFIYEVSISTGRVTRIIDCQELVQRAGPLGPEDLLNGIGYDPDKDEFYITGKRWPIIFRVIIPKHTD